MAIKVEVRLYATLRRHAPPDSAGVMAINTAAGTTVEEILKDLKVDLDEVKLIMINGINAQLDQVLADNDRLGVFPPVGGG